MHVTWLGTWKHVTCLCTSSWNLWTWGTRPHAQYINCGLLIQLNRACNVQIWRFFHSHMSHICTQRKLLSSEYLLICTVQFKGNDILCSDRAPFWTFPGLHSGTVHYQIQQQCLVWQASEGRWPHWMLLITVDSIGSSVYVNFCGKRCTHHKVDHFIHLWSHSSIFPLGKFPQDQNGWICHLIPKWFM